MQQKIDGLLVPNLRFPEFRDAGEWEEKKLNELYTFKGTNSLSRENLNYEHGAAKNIHYGDIHTKFSTLFDIQHEKVPYINTSEPLEKIKPDSYCIEGDMIFADASEDLEDIGKSIELIRLNNERVLSGLHTLLARQIKSRLIVGFGGYLFQSIRIRSQIKRESQGTKVLGISAGRLSKIQVCYPPNKNEQQKIADCLSSISDRITLEAQKLDTLKAHKKGLMQQLFPAEGETLPKLRFPEFQDSGEWEEKRLEQISDIKTGPFGSVLHESDYVEIGTPIITVEHLDELGIKGNNFPKVSDSDRSRLSSYQLKKGDIVFSRVGSVDRCSIIGINEDGWLFSSRLLRLRTRKLEENSPQFLNQLLKYEPSKTKIRNSAVGQTMPSLNTKILNGISLHLPLFVEQQKIADCLSSLDELIAAQAQAIATLKTHKKGLMQQLFPSVDEVKG